MENLQSIIYQKQYQEALKKQIDATLDILQSNEFTSVQGFLAASYNSGYVGTMYDIAGQGIPIITPIDQKQVVKALQTDSNISTNLYTRLGEDVKYLKSSIRAELSRGITQGKSWNEIAVHVAKGMKSNYNKAINNAIRITRTEGHRIQNKATLDAQHEVKEKGADIVKQWDATLDGSTRKSHRKLDGQIRELDEDFEVDGKKAKAPGHFGDPAEDCNCRCAVLQRARCELDESELETLKERAEDFGLDKTKDFEEYKEKYLKATNGLGAKTGGNEIPEHKELKLIKTIDRKNKKAVKKEISTFETDAIKQSIETACVITTDGEVYYCYGVEDRVFPDYDLKDKLQGATISHNHPIKETTYSFSADDLSLFNEYNLDILRGCDELYTYELTRDASDIDELPQDWMNEENYQHCWMIEQAKRRGIGYRRWKNG